MKVVQNTTIMLECSGRAYVVDLVTKRGFPYFTQLWLYNYISAHQMASPFMIGHITGQSDTGSDKCIHDL